jgi:hypothetical protein
MGLEMNPMDVEVDEDNEPHPLVPLGPVLRIAVPLPCK